jgi:Ca2+-binding RTX toxin-like protein
MISFAVRVTILIAIIASGSTLGYTSNHAYARIIGQQTDEGKLVDSVNNLIRCLGNELLPGNVCKGTNNNDKIIAGGVGFQTIFGLDGKDLIQGDIQSDVIYGGHGNDVISGGEGTDSLFGNDGNDVIYGDSGTNAIFGGGGNFIYGNDGNDRLYGGTDNDALTGGSGHDFFDCSEGVDTVTDFDPKEDTANSNCENLL